MSSNTPNYNDQEIDLRQVSQKMGRAYESFLSWIFRGILFVKRNLIVLIVLFLIGAGIGYYLDKNSKVYDHEVIVKPNFGSAEYAYSKVNLIKAKLAENDTTFFKSIGVLNFKILTDIEIEPITDVYEFINEKEQNFELLKLMAESSDLNKIITEETTSINYPRHKIIISTNKKILKDDLVSRILEYLNDSDYYRQVQEKFLINYKSKMVSNTQTIIQIDSVIKTFTSIMTAGNKSAGLVYNNQNIQLNDMLKTKNDLILDQGFRIIELADFDKVVKDSSVNLNLKKNKKIASQWKIIFPVAFIFIFIFLGFIKSFYNRQRIKNETL